MKIEPYTPVDRYQDIYVKREDLCCDKIPLSKIRGAYQHLLKRPEGRIVCLDTWRSLNGLATAVVCQQLRKRCTLGYPVYTSTTQLPLQQQIARDQYDATIIPIPAGRQRIMASRLRGILGPFRSFLDSEKYYMMPDAFRLPETGEAVHEQYNQTIQQLGFRPRCVVVPTGTGTHLSGLLRGVIGEQVFAVLGYSQNLRVIHANLHVIDLGYDYGDEDNCKVPFPASGFYEAKAWRWLLAAKLEGPVLFWNIGASLAVQQ